jgi:hypothetical protein
MIFNYNYHQLGLNMKKIIVNGHGWSGSSAFINLLEVFPSKEYMVIPGEFDDYRVPGTMRETLVSENNAISHRWRNLKPSAAMSIRSIIPDRFWPNIERGKNINRINASVRSSGIIKEKLIFNKYSSLLLNEKNIETKKIILSSWMNEICENYQKFNKESKNIFIEQFYLFDDSPELYEWLEFDSLLLFIRPPGSQLASTLESDVLYNNYPWAAEFLIGNPPTRNKRKYEIFIDTTIKRYSWIINFLNHFESKKIYIVDFNNFLNDYENSVKLIASKLSLNLEENSKLFDIKNSRNRNNEWDNNFIDLESKLNEAAEEYDKFKNILKNKYFTV